MRTSKWVTSYDQTQLHYTIGGQGGPIFLLFDGIGCDGFIWPYLRPYLEEIGTVIHLHMRGHGESAEPAYPEHIEIPHLARDWESLFEQESLTQDQPLIGLGHSMGVQVCLELRKKRPDLNWCGLILMCGTFEHTTSHFHDTQMLDRVLPILRKAAKLGGERLRKVWSKMIRFPFAVQLARMTEMDPNLSRKRDIENYLNHLARLDPQVFLSMLNAAGQHSVRTALGSIHTPALIIAGEKDHFTPARLSEEMVHLMPKGELLMIEGGTHAAPIEHTIEVNQSIRHFIQRCTQVCA